MNASTDEYVTLRKASRVAGVSTHTLLKAAAIGKIRTLARVGEWPRFSTEDAKRYAASLKPTA